MRGVLHVSAVTTVFSCTYSLMHTFVYSLVCCLFYLDGLDVPLSVEVEARVDAHHDATRQKETDAGRHDRIGGGELEGALLLLGFRLRREERTGDI